MLQLNASPFLLWLGYIITFLSLRPQRDAHSANIPKKDKNHSAHTHVRNDSLNKFGKPLAY